MEELNQNMCQKRIWSDRGMIWHQCSKKVKVEVNGKKYCAIHSPEAEKRKEEKYWEKVKKRDEFERKMAIENAIELLKSKGYKITQ